MVAEDLRQRLQAALKPLEDVPPEKQDWHPSSNNQALDLVHPSLYCLVYDRTRGFPQDGRAASERQPKDLRVIKPPSTLASVPINRSGKNPVQAGALYYDIDPKWLSPKFSWIPTEFEISETDEAGKRTAKPLSYINNIDPKMTDLYSAVSEIVARFTHLWDLVLTDLLPENPFPRRTTDVYSRDDNENGMPQQGYLEDDDTYEERWQQWYDQRPVNLPTVPGAGYQGGLEIRKKTFKLAGRTIQVIVKLANIVLVSLVIEL